MRAAFERIRTGLSGLDETLGGGLARPGGPHDAARGCEHEREHPKPHAHRGIVAPRRGMQN
jgi:hypothetical protein